MKIFTGTSNPTAVKIGSQDASAVYRGSERVWPEYLDIVGLEYLVIGGGGTGGTADGYRGGGGGAGGYRTNVVGDVSGGNSPAEEPYPTIPAGTSLRVLVGLGGASGGDFDAESGNSSLFDADGVIKTIESLYGGAGANTSVQGRAGGSSGGAFSYFPCATTPGTAGQGHAGGGENVSNYGSAGGGGAGSAGADGGVSGDLNAGGKGGDPLVSSIDGLNKARAGGGGGAGTTAGGIGSGGAGDGTTGSGKEEKCIAEPNSGSGGGGANTIAGAGGSGVVIVRYPGPQSADGGEVTTHDGYTVHTFNEDGIFEARK